MKKIKFQKLYLDLLITYKVRTGKKPVRTETLKIKGVVKLPK